MLRANMEFEERAARVVAWVPSELTNGDLEERTTRLRSWALIVGATIAGPAFVTMRGAEGARVCLPLAEWYPAHPETGVSVQREPATAVARLTGATVGDARALAEMALAELGGCHVASGDPEFHPVEKGSSDGDVVIPVQADAVPRPHLATV
jgi:hypothetical protein